MKMLPVDEAVRRIFECVEVMGIETVPLVDSLDRILATDVISPVDLPLFSHATVDGYAICYHDVEHASKGKGVRLRVVETISAGFLAKKAMKSGWAVRVMTGTPLPPGADAVVKEEDTSPAENGTDSIQVEKSAVRMENVASPGEDLRRGEVVLETGMTIRPGDIGILASLGIQQAEVFRLPEVALLSTGDELVNLGEDLRPGTIFASSLYVLLAQLRECGCVPLVLGVVGDNTAEIEERIRSGMAADAIITIGGTRSGDSDWVRDVYGQMEIHSKVDGVAMSPGRSFLFGLLKEKPVFSLPGSPTACLVAFEELVKPALMKMKGRAQDQSWSLPTIRMSLEKRIRGARGLRKYILVRVVLQDGLLRAIPVSRKHRGALTPMIQTNGMVVLPEYRSEVQANEEVDVKIFDLNL